MDVQGCLVSDEDAAPTELRYAGETSVRADRCPAFCIDIVGAIDPFAKAEKGTCTHRRRNRAPRSAVGSEVTGPHERRNVRRAGRAIESHIPTVALGVGA